ncbi:MAG: ATP-binding protein, partial [Desulfobacterales bacterium]|nr:ATP-binding protein [Desulfobacterales bacterium]
FSFGTYINKIIELNLTLEKKVKVRTRDLQSVSDQLSYANAELIQIFNTAADGMRVIDENFRVLRVNDTFAKILGNDKEALEGNLCHQDFSGKFCFSENCTLVRIMNGEERIEMDVEKQTGTGESRSFILTATPFRDSDGHIIGVVENFKDITARKKAFRAIEAQEAHLKTLLKKQTVDLKKAKSVMTLINQSVPRYIPVSDTCRLFTEVISIPCHTEGGDHLFVQPFSEGNRPKTCISLKDQSGHEVNCILRSIYTDLLHNAALFKNPKADTGRVATGINRQLCASGFFEPDDFFTAVNAEIDHSTLALEYVSAGHPPMLLIRDRDVRLLPDPAAGNHHLPIPFIDTAEYVASSFQMHTGDQLILYTDGLTEMGMKQLNTTLSPADLLTLVQDIVDDFYAAHHKTMPVSRLIRAILETIAGNCGETVSPGEEGTEPVNTSSDDVSIIGMELEATGNSETLSITPQNDEAVSGFIRSIKTVFNDRHLQEDDSGQKERFAMILEEAVLNAWKHGNQKDPDKSITVRLGCQNDIVMEVIDQGKGFDYNTLPDPTRIENIQKTDGRGLYIIRQFANHVHWEGSGNHICIALNRTGSPPASAPITNLWKRVSY